MWCFWFSLLGVVESRLHQSGGDVIAYFKFIKNTFRKAEIYITRILVLQYTREKKFTEHRKQ